MIHKPRQSRSPSPEQRNDNPYEDVQSPRTNHFVPVHDPHQYANISPDASDGQPYENVPQESNKLHCDNVPSVRNSNNGNNDLYYSLPPREGEPSQDDYYNYPPEND